jgi:hypothetical protein
MICRLAEASSSVEGPDVRTVTDALHPRRRLAAEQRDTSNSLLFGISGRENDPKPKQYGGLPTLDGFKFDGDIKFKGEKAEMWTYTLKVRPAFPSHGFPAVGKCSWMHATQVLCWHCILVLMLCALENLSEMCERNEHQHGHS